jgi:hypothetical protein
MKSRGAAWHNFFAQSLTDLGFVPWFLAKQILMFGDGLLIERMGTLDTMNTSWYMSMTV